tara:strand:+ start:415 stop:888 length:474 start_codon:yes stop_codon:yes gene_type:complete
LEHDAFSHLQLLQDLTKQNLFSALIHRLEENPFANFKTIPARGVAGSALERPNERPVVFHPLPHHVLDALLELTRERRRRSAIVLRAWRAKQHKVGRWRGRRRGEHGDCRWEGESGSSDGSVGGVVDTISHQHGPRHDSRQKLPLPRANQVGSSFHK